MSVKKIILVGLSNLFITVKLNNKLLGTIVLKNDDFIK